MREITRHVRLALVTATASLGIGALVAGGAQAAALGAFTTKGAYSYASTPKLHPPKIAVKLHTKASKLVSGYFMVGNFPDLTRTEPVKGTPQLMVGQSGPLLLDSHMQPVWFKPVPENVVAVNFTTQTYNGKPALSWWQGVVTNTGQIVSGEDVVVDQHYKTIATLQGADGWVIALHEMVISGQNAWVIASRNVPGDYSAYGGPAHGVLVDTAVQEYDLKTGALKYTWDPMVNGVAPSESYQSALPNGVWDAYHVNSLELTGNGTFLVSMRNTWTAYMVDRATGDVDWRLGGKHSSFAVPANAQFQWQHDVVLHSGNIVSVFDDHCCAIVGAGKFAAPTGPSRGLVLKLDTTHHTASFVSQFTRDASFDVAFLGNTQLLSNGNALVGWGSQPFFSEFSKSGKLLLDATLPTPDLSYRVYLQRWVGLPLYPPDGAVRKNGSHTTVYASWNGATKVVSWRVLGGTSAKHLATVATATRSGFETAIGLTKSYKAYKVVALDSKGKVLGRSNVFPSQAPQFGGY